MKHFIHETLLTLKMILLVLFLGLREWENGISRATKERHVFASDCGVQHTHLALVHQPTNS